MAIDELGAELSRRSEQKGIDRRKEERRNRNKDMLRQLATKSVVGGVKSFMETKQARNAFAFMQREPIQAARAKYNQGVDDGIAVKSMWNESLNHVNGQEQYGYEKFQPMVEKEMMKIIDEESYKKDAFDRLVDTRTREYVKNTWLPSLREANTAADKIGNDKNAFEQFVKLNDGIPDSSFGTFFRGIGNFFRGKDKIALRHEAAENVIANSDFVEDAEAVSLARMALGQGYSINDAAAIGSSLKKYKLTDDDFTKLISSKDKTETVYSITGKQHTIHFREEERANGWGATRTKRIAHDPSEQHYFKLKPRIEEENSIEKSRGQVYRTSTKVLTDENTGDVISTTYSKERIGSEPGQGGTISEGELQAFIPIFRKNYARVKNKPGSEDYLKDENMLENYIKGGDGIPTPEGSGYTDMIDGFYRNLMWNGNLIEEKFQSDKIEGNSKGLSDLISQHVVFNDMRRITEYGWTDYGHDIGDFPSTMGNEHSPVEVLEAIGSVKESNQSITINPNYIEGIANSSYFFKEIENLANDEDPTRLHTFIQSLNAVKEVPAYSHLFRPMVKLGETSGEIRELSVFETLNFALSYHNDRKNDSRFRQVRLLKPIKKDS